MRKMLLSAAAFALIAGAAQAQTTVITTQQKPSEGEQAAGTLAGTGTGAVAGALVGGPVGAVVGGVAGTVIGGAAASAPEEVRTYVTQNPTAPVVVQGDIADGYTIPETVTLTPVPSDPEYAYFYAGDNRPVIVNKANRKVVYIVKE